MVWVETFRYPSFGLATDFRCSDVKKILAMREVVLYAIELLKVERETRDFSAIDM